MKRGFQKRTWAALTAYDVASRISPPHDGTEPTVPTHMILVDLLIDAMHLFDADPEVMTADGCGPAADAADWLTELMDRALIGYRAELVAVANGEEDAEIAAR